MKKTFEEFNFFNKPFTLILIEGEVYRVNEPHSEVDMRTHYVLSHYDERGIKLVKLHKSPNRNVLIPWTSISRIEF